MSGVGSTAPPDDTACGQGATRAPEAPAWPAPEREGTRPLLVMTAGLRDAYSIARHDRKELYALRYHKPERLVPRRDVVEVVERLRWDGSVEVPLERASVEALIERLREARVEAV